MRFRILTVCTVLVVGLVMMTAVSSAADKGSIKLKAPKTGYTAYAGEKIDLSFAVTNKNKKKTKRDLWPWIRIFDKEKGSYSDYYATNGLVRPKETVKFTETVKLPKNYPEKNYKLRIIAVPYKVGGSHPDYRAKKKGWEKGMIQKTITIKVKYLFWPESLKLTATKGKITLKYSAVKGATGYEVYRSTKAKGKYKSIGKSKKITFTDKKVKAGKTYYYRIKTIRNKHGLIKSEFGPRGKIKAQ